MAEDAEDDSGGSPRSELHLMRYIMSSYFNVCRPLTIQLGMLFIGSGATFTADISLCYLQVKPTPVSVPYRVPQGFVL